MQIFWTKWPTFKQNKNEWNGNYSTDFSKPFSINGLEFDLVELELYENRLKCQPVTSNNQTTADNVDDLDEYLERMALNSVPQDKSREKIATDLPSTSAACIQNYTDNVTIIETADANIENRPHQTDANLSRTSFPLLLFGLLSILVFVNSVHCKLKWNTKFLCESPNDFIYTGYNTSEFFFFFLSAKCFWFYLWLYYLIRAGTI